MSNQANGLSEFGAFQLDGAKRLLTRDGESITLAPKTFDVLLLLVESQGRVLTKRELLNTVWPNTFVEEASLSYQIAMLRKALGKEGDFCIETVPKRTAGCSRLSPSAASASRSPVISAQAGSSMAL